ncbi:MAG: cob(I)yrinic acid a,c-diamide adenosyltransferase [Desulfurococcales archaeon]|nr:cob(I)yrinic acid a,c-diamide adenosyltransferase [Desulfurococcales archaeon]
MSLYTRTGDQGTTYCAVLKQRVPKDHPIIEFVGALDEANSMLGLAKSLLPETFKEESQIIENVQRLIFNAGFSPLTPDKIGSKDIEWTEKTIDRFYSNPLRHFILPGGHPASAALHVARTVLRRAERRLVAIQNSTPGIYPEYTLKLLNRLSDLLFALALNINSRLGIQETPL